MLLYREFKLHFEFNLAVLLYFCSLLSLPLSASIGKFLGLLQKKFIHSRASGPTFAASFLLVSLYKSRNPIPESATSDYAATCASLRAHRDILYTQRRR